MSKILFLSHRVPYPPNKGDKIRAFHVLQYLARSHDIWLGAFADEAEELAHVGWLEERCRGVRIVRRHSAQTLARIALAGAAGRSLSVGSFAHSALSRWCERIEAEVKPDLVYVFSSAMAQFVTGAGKAKTPLITDFVDVDSEKFRQYAAVRKGVMRLLYKTEAERLLRFDRSVAAASRACLFVSRTERDLFLKHCPEMADRLHVIPNGVDCAYFDPARSPHNPCDQAPLIVFTGRMDYFPNVDAVSWFAQSILPLVRESVPQAKFRIVGAKPSAEVSALTRLPGVEVTGGVADIRPHYAQAAVSVAPLRIARGIQNKVLEAMAMARPVVVTPEALDGISAEDGAHVLVARSEAGIAHATLSVLKGEAPPGLGSRARTRVLAQYDWSAQLAPLSDLIAEFALRPNRG
jgi:sugar transferase (PEP-CTERM/EpsH1 system associated)